MNCHHFSIPSDGSNNVLGCPLGSNCGQEVDFTLLRNTDRASDPQRNINAIRPQIDFLDNLTISDGGGITFVPKKLSEFSMSYLIGVQSGDYMWIDTGYIQGTPHGFLVVGWGPIISCPTAIGTTWLINSIDEYQGFSSPEIALSPLFPTKDSAIDYALLDPDYSYVVPYVVDFPRSIDRTQENISSGALPEQLQRPRPRPFYCSAYLNPSAFTSTADFGVFTPFRIK